MRRTVGILAALAAVLVIAELTAVPLASRLLSDAAARCIRHETFEVTEVDRPVLPRLVLGRARDVEVVATGLRVGELRVDRAELSVPEATLPWAPGEPGTLDGQLTVTLSEGDVTAFVRSLVPVPLPVTVVLDGDLIQLGALGVPLTVDLSLAVTADGTVDLAPVAGDVELLERLGLQLELDPGDQVQITELLLADGQLAGSADLRVVPGLSDGQGCDEPL